jgi:hypothetical protein
MRSHYASVLLILPEVIFLVFTSSAQGQGVSPGSDFRTLERSPTDQSSGPGQVVPPVPGSSEPRMSDLVPQLPDSAQRVDEGLPVAPDDYQRVWGVIGMRAFPFGQQVAPNGVEYMPFFTLDMDFNMWILRSQRVYLFVDSDFWAQKPGAGITNPSQGYFDFSKRELDFSAGVAWNYCSNWEARIFAYSYNNLNRGDSTSSPSGFNDGIGIENRWYLNEEYARLGRQDYDVDRAAFVSAGYYPTKDMIDNDGKLFKPALFARAYLVQNLYNDIFYVYLDTQFLTEKPATPKMLYLDGGFAVYPFPSLPYLQFRLGTQDSYDLQAHEWEASMYLGVRVRF